VQKTGRKYTLFHQENQGKGPRFIGTFSIFAYFLALSGARSTDSQILEYFLPLVLGFLVGSIPTTFLLVKWRKRVDIRKEGTGNVGAMNAFEVTGSAWVGFAAALLDILKGAAAVLVAGRFFGDGFWVLGVAGIAAVLGHNYSPWIGFKGGRGLSTAFGSSLVLGWIIGVIWLALFAVVFFLRKDVHAGNIAASLILPGLVSVLPTPVVNALVPGASHADLAWISLCFGAVILLGHFKVIMQFLQPSLRNQ
jgi:glycerol-3-phosphate acyltransferase PlsY